MSNQYVNARFKSQYYEKKRALKVAEQYRLPSKPTIDNVPIYNLAKHMKASNKLSERSMRMADADIKPLLFQKVSNHTDFGSLNVKELVIETALPAYKTRNIPNQTFSNSGTVNVGVKTVPLIQHVGCMENHPRNKVDVELMEQKALRNLADLPSLLEKLKLIGITPPQQQQQQQQRQPTTRRPPASPPQSPPQPPQPPQKRGAKPTPASTAPKKETSSTEQPFEKASRLLRVLEPLIQSVGQYSSDQVDAQVIAVLDAERVSYGQRNRSQSSMHEFLTTSIQQCKDYILNNPPSKENI
jgi:hypothetical protein